MGWGYRELYGDEEETEGRPGAEGEKQAKNGGYESHTACAV
jgi:hypothetical protein